MPVAQGMEWEEAAACVRYRLTVKGIVQGVGFRPFVFQLANRLGLVGTVGNTSWGVIIEIEGRPAQVAYFVHELTLRPPRLARIEAVEQEVLEPAGYVDFQILASQAAGVREALIPPDIATCEDCRREVFDPRDRHYRYPFTNCTNCGPRFTIIRDVPYDRPQTSMQVFPMCLDCTREYRNPADRRFHAQPVACPACGPRMELVDVAGVPVAGDWLANFHALVQKGCIVAVKGLGGFHLACDAHNGQAIGNLRQRKRRPARPLAVMARDMDTVRRYCRVSPEEAVLLQAPEAPIVILEQQEGNGLPEELAPGMRTLGVMLPYTPLHLLLMSGFPGLLVMTSANPSDLPLVKDNAEARQRLGGIADYFLWYNREIVNRCDDSLAAVVEGQVQVYRRSRGFVPRAIAVPLPESHSDLGHRGAPERPPCSAGGPIPAILGIGSEMKNTFCLLKGEQAFLSQHIGELEAVETVEHLRRSLEHFCRLLEVRPEVIVYDLHPSYLSSRVAQELPATRHLAVQHHHAHLVSCLADNDCFGPAIGLILDGTGYGPDGAVWGGEIFTGDGLGYHRHFHLAYLPLPGGEAAVRRPWRMAVAYLLRALGEDGERVARELFLASPAVAEKELRVVEKQVQTGFNSPLTSSCGRLFDAVSAFLGVCLENTYEGQAAAELGELVLGREGEALQPYGFTFRGEEIDLSPMWQELVADRRRGREGQEMARRFHDTLAVLLVEAARQVAETTGLEQVVLSGGVWQNRYLLVRVKKMLEQAGLRPLVHRQVPCNDGGLSLGQAIAGYWQERRSEAGDQRQVEEAMGVVLGCAR